MVFGIASLIERSRSPAPAGTAWRQPVGGNSTTHHGVPESRGDRHTGRDDGGPLSLRHRPPAFPREPACSNPFKKRAAVLAGDGPEAAAPHRRAAGSCCPSAARRPACRSPRSRWICIANWIARTRSDSSRRCSPSSRPIRLQVLKASKAYAFEQSAANLGQLNIAAEPPRQELLRRLNRAPGGTATILRMRERLLELTSGSPNSTRSTGTSATCCRRGSTPDSCRSCAWTGARRRTCWSRSSRTRRCTRSADGTTCAGGSRPIAGVRIFHPALPDEPLIFVEVALLDRMADAVAPVARRAVRRRTTRRAPRPRCSTRSATASRACAACRSETS